MTPTSNPLFLHRSKVETYEYSAEANALGFNFVSGCCSVVRRQRHEAGVTQKTWVDNYVIRLGSIFHALVWFSSSNASSADQPDQFETDDWLSFSTLLETWIIEQPVALITRNKLLRTTGKLLTILHREGVIPFQLELMSTRQKDRSKDGSSRFTQRGWGRQPAACKSDTAYSFCIPEHGREYDYAPFRETGRQFVLHVTAFLKDELRNETAHKAKRMHETWLSVLRHLQSSRECGDSADFYRKLDSDSFREIAAETWEANLYAWREALERQAERVGRKKITSHSTIKRLNALWSRLTAAGLVPAVELVGIKNAKSRYFRESRPTLSQLTSTNATPAPSILSASARVVELFDHADRGEARDYLTSLCQALTPELVSELPVEAVIDEIHNLNSSRLSKLRQAAEGEFRHWFAHWQTGQVAYSNSSLDGSELLESLDNSSLSVSEQRRNSARLLFDPPEHERLGHALRYIEAKYDGSISGIHGRIHHLARSFGGRPALMGYLHPHEHATLALWVMALIDTGANCEVVRATPWNCLRPSKKPGARQIVLGPKNRSGGRIIVDEFTEDASDGSLSLVRAIEQYQRMAFRFHAQSAGKAANLLFLHDTQGHPQALTEWTARKWFVEFLERHPELGMLDARPSMIRPSVLMDIQHRNGGRVDAARYVADHGSSTTTLQHYTGRIPTKLRYTLNIRSFQDRLQSVVVVTIDGAAAKLGMSQAQFETLFTDAARTGLGVACLNPLAGVQPGTRQGEQCTRLDACWNCSMRWVVATVDNIADLISFHQYLKSAAEKSSSSHADWEERWLPWLAFSDVALQKLREGECAGLYLQAETLAEQRRATYPHMPLG